MRPVGVNDPDVVRREYGDERRFLSRRLSTWAHLLGPSVEDELVRRMAALRPQRVLEVGCGIGDVTERMQRELDPDLVATDLSPRMAELTARRQVKACVADIEHLPFAGDVYSCVVANRVLYHLPDLDRGLAQIVRVLRPGGALLAVTYSEEHLGELADVVGERLVASTFSAEAATEALERQFDNVEREDVCGTARFETVDDVRAFLSQGFGSQQSADVAGSLRGLEAPFEATYRLALFVATTVTASPRRGVPRPGGRGPTGGSTGG